MTQWLSEVEFLIGPNSTEFEFFDVVHNRIYSWEEFSRIVSARRTVFQNCGIKRGDRILITHGNSLEFLVDTIAALSCHASVIVADGGLKPAEMLNVMNDSQPDFVVNKYDDIKRTKATSADTRRLVLNSPALILLTSGTTGLPKLVVLETNRIKERLEAIEIAIPRTQRARSLCVLPTHFGHGLIGICLSSLYSGCQLAMLPTIDLSILQKLDELIDRARPTFLSGTPATWETLLRYTSKRKSPLIRAQIASAHASAGLFNRVKEWAGCAVYNVYGMTETASWISAKEFRTIGDEAVVGDGKIWGTLFRIDNIEADEFGSVSVQTSRSGNGFWYSTGDRGKIDDRGELILSGRQSRVINRRGVKVSAEEVELALLSLPMISDAIVLAVGGELDSVGAMIVVNPALPARTEAEITAAINHDLSEKLSEYKRPTRFWLVETIPRRANGKPDLKEIGFICNSEK